MGEGNVTRLSAPLRRAVDRALARQRATGVELRVTPGWRSAEHQARLYAEAIDKVRLGAARPPMGAAT
jgi:hypothetical protein